MVRGIFILILGLLISQSVIAQSDTITAYEMRGGNYSFFINDTPLTKRKMLVLMKPVPEAFQEMRRSKSNSSMSNIMGFLGGFLIGFPLGTAARGGEPVWEMAGLGVIFIGFSIPLNRTAKKNAFRAVKYYNREICGKADPSASFVKFGMTRHGAGFIVYF